MYEIIRSSRAKKDLRRHEKSGAFPLAKFKLAMVHLRAGEPLPLSFRDHQLKGSLLLYREFHLAQDILVQYKRDDKLRIIIIMKVGTHAELFGR